MGFQPLVLKQAHMFLISITSEEEHMLKKTSYFLVALCISFIVSKNSSFAADITFVNQSPNDWAPFFHPIISPINAEPVTLILDKEENGVAFYKVSPGTKEPNDSICTQYPSTCRLTRDNLQ